jgi:hypothetical protein
MITFVVNVAQEQYEGAEQCHDKRHWIGVPPRLEEPHHSNSTEGGISILGLTIDYQATAFRYVSSRDHCLLSSPLSLAAAATSPPDVATEADAPPPRSTRPQLATH